ncbi:MAG: hypothetical protein ACOY93_04340 [Bacillota bacterium]
MVGSLQVKAGSKEVRGARLTMTVSALIELPYFGLLALLGPASLFEWLFRVPPAPMEVVWIHAAGAVSLALGVGCWYARGGGAPVIRLMSLVMTVAKSLAAAVFLVYLISGMLAPMHWVNFGLVTFLAGLNGWQFIAAMED